MMNKKQIVVTLIALVLAVGTLFAVLLLRKEENPELQRYSTTAFGYFDTVTTVSGYAESGENFQKIANEIGALLNEYHKLYDIYNEYEGINNLCTINKLYDGEHRVVKVDRKIIDMLLYAKNLYTKTNGKMNIAMGSVLSIWHDYREEADENFGVGELPPMADLEEAALHTDINDLIIDEENSTVYLADPQMKLDVGAIAKGYAVEMIARELEARGITGYVLNVGGNIRTIGTKADGDRWLAGVENPGLDIGKSYIAYVGLAGQAIVTSGSYQRYYIVDGEAYHQIIDPETLMPATYFVAVSIICEHSGDGDGLSTAVFCMPLEEGMALIESLDGVEAMWTFSDGTIVKSSGFSNFEVEYE
jgi:thiamine biosynthesis lipoprotein